MSQQAQAVVQPQRKAPIVSSLKGSILQRKCECGQHTLAGGECESCRKKREETLLKGAPSGVASTLQRAAVNSTPAPVGVVPPAVHNVLSSPGRPLDRSTRSLMESRFGHDFSQVRVHSDPQAAESASAVQARAYTVGEHVVFGAGKYAPDTTAGKHLLAHELTHTIQQHGMQRYASDGPLSISTHDGALEHEAEMAASAVIGAGHGMDAAARVSHRPLTPVVSRAKSLPEPTPPDNPDTFRGKKIEKTKLDKPLPVYSKGQHLTQEEIYDEEHVRFIIDKLVLPETKGPALEMYEAVADAGALEAVLNLEGTPKAGLWQERAGTSELLDAWREKVGWSNEEAIENWYQAGGKRDERAFKQINPTVTGAACQMDHIVELQLRGTNVKENVQVLNASDNQKSGSELRTQVTSIAVELRKGRASKAQTIILHFESVSGGGKAEAGCQGPGKATSCSQVESCATKQGKKKPTTAQVDSLKQDYPIEATGIKTNLKANPAPEDTDLHEGAIAENMSATELISGIVLQKLHRPKSHKDSLEACLDTEGCQGSRAKTRLPIKVEGKQELLFQIDENGHLHLPKKGEELAFVYPYLSKGHLRLDYSPEKGITGEGKLKPSVPFLSSAELTVHLEEGAFNATISKKPTTLPIPNSRITKAEIGVELAPQFGAKGEVAFEVGPKAKPILDGLVTAGADESGFVAKGTLNAHLPGIDETKGEVMYRNGELTGGVDIKFGQTRLKLVKGGLVHIGLVGKDINATGEVIILLPRGKEAKLSVERGKAGNWIYRGAGEFDIPGLKPVHIEIDYDGERLNARGHTDIVIKGMKGQLLVIYKDGRISGEGKLNLERGRAKGHVNAKLSDELNLSGEGEIQYQLSENLIGTIGVVLHEDQSVRVKGQLEFPKPIQLFKGFSSEYELFDYSMDIPIIAIPLGPVSLGLIGRISGGMKVNYGIGPGELRDVHVMAAFNPLEEKKDLELEAGAVLVIPAHAGVSIYIRGAIGLSVVIASVTGGITAKGTAELRGGLQAPVSIHYIRGRFDLDAKPTILAELILKLGLDADVTAEAGVWPLKYEAQKVWNLASYEWGSGLQFGLTVPIHYASDEEFHMPSASDIVWIKPNIDLETLVPRLARQAIGKES